MSNTVFSVYSHRELQYQSSKRLPPAELTGSTVIKVRPSSPETMGNWQNLLAKTETFVPAPQKLERSRRFAENAASVRTIQAEYNFEKPENYHIKIIHRDESPVHPGRLENLFARGDDRNAGWKPNTRKHYSPDQIISPPIDITNAPPKIHPMKQKLQEGELKTFLQPSTNAMDLLKRPQSQQKNYLLQSSITTLPGSPYTLKVDIGSELASRRTSTSSKSGLIRGTYTSEELRRMYGIQDKKPQKRDPNMSFSTSLDESRQINPHSSGVKRSSSPNAFQSLLRVYDREWKSPEKKHVDLNRSMQRSTFELI